jgi:hypothetical protein
MGGDLEAERLVPISVGRQLAYRLFHGRAVLLPLPSPLPSPLTPRPTAPPPNPSAPRTDFNHKKTRRESFKATLPRCSRRYRCKSPAANLPLNAVIIAEPIPIIASGSRSPRRSRRRVLASRALLCRRDAHEFLAPSSYRGSRRKPVSRNKAPDGSFDATHLTG